MTYKNKPKIIKKTVVAAYIVVITLSINRLNASTKRDRLTEWIQKQGLYTCCLQETHFRPGDTYKLANYWLLVAVFACKGTSVMSTSLKSYGLWPTRLLCPWDSPGKNTGVCCHALLQDLPDPGIEPASLKAPALAGSLFTASATWESVTVFRLYLTSFLFNPLKIRLPWWNLLTCKI